MAAQKRLTIHVYHALSYTLAFNFKLLEPFHYVFTSVCHCISVLTWVCSPRCKSCVIILKDMQSSTFNNSCLSLQMVLLRSDESVKMLFWGDESLIPVLDYSNHTSKQGPLFCLRQCFPLVVMGNEKTRRLRCGDMTGYVLTEDLPW